MEAFLGINLGMNRIVHQESLGMPEDVCRDFLRNVVPKQCYTFRVITQMFILNFFLS